MALQAVIGQPFTFEVLFVDDTNTPINVNNPTINIFTFTPLGGKQTLVSSPMVPVVPPETGRYVYTYMIPTTFNDGDSIYGEMGGVDPTTSLNMITEQQVVAISANRGQGGGGSIGGACCCGLVANFVKGG